MKWIVILLLIAGCYWAYNNVDFANLANKADTSVRNEKNLKNFFKADEMNKQDTQKALEEF